MENFNFIAQAQHNSARLQKSTRNLLIIILICVVGIIISQIFYDQYTTDAVYLRTGMQTKAGWPATLFSISSWGLIAFTLFFAFLKMAQDATKPAFGITKDGVFINQQMIRNAFVPWNNIESTTLIGSGEDSIIRLKFKDIDSLLKGQFFLFKSISKASLNTNPSFSISKDNCTGDFKKMYELIQEKIEKI